MLLRGEETDVYADAERPRMGSAERTIARELAHRDAPGQKPGGAGQIRNGIFGPS